MANFPTPREMEEKFSKAFSPEQTSTLVEVIDTIRQAELRREADTQDLKRGLAKLATAQQKTEERIDKLATAQQKTEERIDKLATAQQKTEASVDRLSKAVQELTETVNTGLRDLRQAVGSLANTFGFSLEEFVAALLPPYLEKHAGVTDLTLGRRHFELNGGQPAEVDLVGEGRQEEQPVLVLAECRTTLGGSEMRRLAAKLEAIEATLGDQRVLKIVVAMNLHPTGAEAAAETGVWAIPYSRINRDRY